MPLANGIAPRCFCAGANHKNPVAALECCGEVIPYLGRLLIRGYRPTRVIDRAIARIGFQLLSQPVTRLCAGDLERDDVAGHVSSLSRDDLQG